MRDSDVRGAVRNWLAAKYAGPGTRIVEEMGIWSGSVRIDMAVINGQLHGFELKSERDTLSRLEGQADLYSQVFDRVTLVSAHKHIAKAESKVPAWWGIASAITTSTGEVRLKTVRQAKQNPKIEPLQVARLLWRSEALAILDRLDLSKGYKSRTADVIFGWLAEALSLKELSHEVRETLKQRAGWLGEPVGDKRDVTANTVRDPFRSSTSTAASGRGASDLFNFGVAPATD